jgi:hypothetical protein
MFWMVQRGYDEVAIAAHNIGRVVIVQLSARHLVIENRFHAGAVGAVDAFDGGNTHKGSAGALRGLGTPAFPICSELLKMARFVGAPITMEAIFAAVVVPSIHCPIGHPLRLSIGAF